MIVAGEHDDRFDTLPAERGNRVATGFTGTIGDGDDAEGLAVTRHQDRRPTLRADCVEPGMSLR